MSKIDVYELIFEITRFCNLDCVHCLRGDSETKYMSTETIDTTFSSIASIENLVLSGGEPLVAIKQLNDVADSIIKHGTKIENIIIITNGTVLGDNVINALARLKPLCDKFAIKVSSDKFHLMSIDRKGLQEKRDENFKVLNELYDASAYGEVTEGKNTVYYITGRARNITEEDLAEINNWGNIKTAYRLVGMDDDKYSIFHPGYPIKIDFSLRQSHLNIDVHGNVVEYYVSYVDCDKYANDSVNINKVGLKNAILNRKPYFYEVEEYHKQLKKSKGTN